MATLNDAAKRFIVQALACYDTPTEVSAALKEEMGTRAGHEMATLRNRPFSHPCS